MISNRYRRLLPASLALAVACAHVFLGPPQFFPLRQAAFAAQIAETKKAAETKEGAAPAAGTRQPQSNQQAAGSAAPSAATAESLSGTQQQLAAEFKDFQAILMKMRDQQTDPNRATLIEKALKESGERRVDSDLHDIVELLRHDKYGDAARMQGKVNEDLDVILKLLMSENDKQRIQDDKAKIRKILDQVNGIIREQKDVQGRTASGDDPKSLAPEQGGLAQRTGNLSKDTRPNQENAGAGEGKEGDKGQPKSDGKSDSKPDGKSDADGKVKEPKPSPKDPSKPGEKADKGGKDNNKADKDNSKGGKADKDGKNDPSSKGEKASPGNAGKPQDGKGQKSQGQGQGQDQGSNDQNEQAQNPNNPPQDSISRRLQAAQEHMNEAQKNLDKAKKEGAVKEQDDALRDLQAAKAELEDILRQLREEEMKRLLAQLEARFRKVLQIQREIYDGTLRVDKVPVAERSHSYEIDTVRLSNREAEITAEVEKALSLLREDGTSVAMPEAVQQVHDDMQQLVHRLAEGKSEVLTQNIEQDVIRALEEIVDAFKKAQKEGKKDPGPPGDGGQPGDPPLIEKLAELKTIRLLQNRVNNRTDRYSKLITGDNEAKDADVREALRRLSEQEARVQKITRDLELGRNL
jgi:hypothetical protein